MIKVLSSVGVGVRSSAEELVQFELRRGKQNHGNRSASRIAGPYVRDVFDIKFTTLDGREVHTKAGFTKSEFNKLLRDFVESGEMNKKTAAAVRKEMAEQVNSSARVPGKTTRFKTNEEAVAAGFEQYGRFSLFDTSKSEVAKEKAYKERIARLIAEGNEVVEVFETRGNNLKKILFTKPINTKVNSSIGNTIRLRSVYDRLGNQGDRILIKDSRKHVADISYHGGKFVVGIIGYKQWIVDGSDINAAYDTLEMKLEEYFRNNHIRVNVEIERTDLPSSVYSMY
jgi:polyhydroxyalkanoate synthesis regulator phasin